MKEGASNRHLFFKDVKCLLNFMDLFIIQKGIFQTKSIEYREFVSNDLNLFGRRTQCV